MGEIKRLRNIIHNHDETAQGEWWSPKDQGRYGRGFSLRVFDDTAYRSFYENFNVRAKQSLRAESTTIAAWQHVQRFCGILLSLTQPKRTVLSVTTSRVCILSWLRHLTVLWWI